MTLQELYGRLERHDWWYEYSDSGHHYRRGSASAAGLKKAAQESPAHAELYSSYHEHVFSGPAWNTEKKPKPAMPA